MPTTYYYTVNDEIIGEHTLGQGRLDYVSDALGSVVATVDQTLTVKSTARYKPYGADLAVTGTQVKFGWVGRFGSRKTDCQHAEQYNWARHLGTKEGRWTTLDPLWPIEPGYSYVKANPPTIVDPSGLQGLNWDPSGGLFDPGRCQRWGEDIVQRISNYLSPPPCFPPTSRDQAIDCFAELLAKIDRTGALKMFVRLHYGKCCGLKLRCNKDTQPVVDCLDRGCAVHDGCLGGVGDYMNIPKQCSCNAGLCKAAKACNCNASSTGFLGCQKAREQVIDFYCILIPTLLRCP